MTVKEFMLKSGAKMSLKGYDELKKCIEMAIEEPDVPVSKIQMVIAEREGSTYPRIERNIRTCIEKAYPFMDKELKRTLFSRKERVTAGDYIKSVAYAIRKGVI